jgi:Na+/phosphate symporter
VVLPPGLRRATLTVHVAVSVGWFGSVLAFLALALAGWADPDARTADAVAVALRLLAGGLLVPLAVLSLLTGVVQSLTTPWGLLRHYWVVVKLALTVGATVVLVLHLGTLDRIADAGPGAGGRAAALSPVLHSGAAPAVLLVVIALSVHKPKGLTRYGWRVTGGRRAHHH